MGRQLTKQSLGKVYREFSRQKYNKYKHQFPKMRESEVVLKIIKQWEMLGTPQKSDLNEKYSAGKTIKDDDNNSCMETAQKPTSHKVDIYTPSPYSKTHVPMNIYPPLFPGKKGDQYDSQINKKSEKWSQDYKSENSSSYSIVVTKSINKDLVVTNKTRYILFYRYQYSKLVQEHATWNAAKVSQIIKLLWQKKQKVMKKAADDRNKKHLTKLRARKVKSGRKQFSTCKRKQGFSPKDTKQLWKKLTRDTRRFYTKRGKGEQFPKKRNQQTSLVTLRWLTPLQDMMKL